MSRQAFFAAILLAVVSLTACEGVMLHDPGNLQVTLALEGEKLEVVDKVEISQVEGPDVQHSHTHESITYVFRPSDGADPIGGFIADTRVIRSEFDANGQPDPRELVMTSGLMDVQLPGVPGLLELRNADGEPIGQVEIDPDAPVTRQSALMSDDDVLGRPVKIVNHGSHEEKIDILFLPEGYKEGDMSKFHDHVRDIANKLSRSPGYKEHWSGFNVLRWDVRSNTRGTGSNGRGADTAFETASGVSGLQRCVFFSNSRGQQAARDLGRRVGADVTVVLVNSTMHGGCARDGVVVSARPSYVADVVAHEVAHGLFGLADEYESARTSGHCSTGPNVSASATNLPWASMVNTNQLPTPESAGRGTIGAFEGAGYCSRGRYRPTHDCMMRSLGADMCPVCRHVVAETMAPYVDGGSSSSSTSSSSSSTSSSSSSSGSTSTGSSSTGLSAPGDLSPDLIRVGTQEVRLTWDAVSGATNYRVKVERKSGSSWSAFGTAETSGTSARVNLRAEGGEYQWSVEACNSGGCATSSTAYFTYNGSTSGGSTTDTSSSSNDSGTSSSSGSSSSSSVPALPGNLKPSDSTATSDATPSFSWDSVSGAAYYNFKMVHREAEGSWPNYVSAQRVDSNRVSTTLRTPEHWYAFAVQACNSNGCSDWTEWSRVYYRP